MGAFLEMTTATRLALAMLPLVALTACGDLDNSRGSIVGTLIGSLFSRGGDAPVGPMQRAGFTPAEMGANIEGFQLFTINAMGIAEPARRISSANGRETWEGESGYTATYENGILATTHGLMFDLIAADTAATGAALRQGGGAYGRAIEVMDSTDQLSRIDFDCTLTAQGSEAVNLGVREAMARKFTENCRSAVVIFENTYWLDAGGDLIASQQYVSPTVAYLRSNRL